MQHLIELLLGDRPAVMQAAEDDWISKFSSVGINDRCWSSRASRREGRHVQRVPGLKRIAVCERYVKGAGVAAYAHPRAAGSRG